jgi:hypothetical protein
VGFVVPKSQHDIVDAPTGRTIARVDHWWEDTRAAGEFDGVATYSEAYTRPEDNWRDVLAREKQREDAIRRTGAGVMRWLWKGLRDRQRFEKLLVHRGVPRRAMQPRHLAPAPRQRPRVHSSMGPSRIFPRHHEASRRG